MKQSTLNFAAAKRTGSAGKPKVSSTKPKTSQLATSKREISEDHIDNYDDIVLKESSGEEIEEAEAEAVNSTPSRVDATELSKEISASTRKTRLQTKNSLLSTTTKTGKEKDSNVENASQPFKSNLNPEDSQKKIEANESDSEILPELDPSSKRWNKLHHAAKAQLGGVPIHGKNDNKVKQILRVFDNSYDYGPCLGMTRLERWERANSLGLNPPKEVYEILMTKQGQSLDEYKQSVFHGEV